MHLKKVQRRENVPDPLTSLKNRAYERMIFFILKGGELTGFKTSRKKGGEGEGNITLTCDCPLHTHFITPEAVT